jgi:putative DNA primase/helicase
MSLQAIVQTLGGEIYDRGRRANIPAPGHSRHDRSVSLLLEGDRVVVHTFGGGDWREVLDHLRELKLIDAANTPLSVALADRAAAPAPATRLERRVAALRLWEGGGRLVGTASERYCRSRGVTRDLPGREVLRHNPTTPVSAYREGGYARPALLAAIQAPDGAILAVEVTYLTAQGARASDLRLNRKTVGPTPGGCAVRLDPAAPEMLVGEGVFTALSASEWFGLPAWALMSTRNLRAWSAPEGVRSVLIAADRGADGERSAETLRGRLSEAGVAASVALPPEPFGDWNEWSSRRGSGPASVEESGKEGTRRVRPGAG